MAKFRRIISICLVLCMFASALPMQILAADVTETTSTETTTEGGVTTVVTTTTTTTVDEDTTTVTVTIDTVKSGTDETGANVEYHETSSETTVSTTSGATTETTEKWEKDGGETLTWDEIPEGIEAPEVKDVTVGIIPGEETTSGDMQTVTTVTGDVKEGDDDLVYDYTETTVTVEKEVTVTTSDAVITIHDSSTGNSSDEASGLIGVAPVYDETDNAVYKSDGKLDDNYGKIGVFDRNWLSMSNGDPSKWVDENGNSIMPEDADFRYVGTGEHSIYWTAAVYVEYEKELDENGNVKLDENGEPIYAKDENGDPIIKCIRRKQGEDVTTGKPVADGYVTTELPAEITFMPAYDYYNGSRPTTFMLMDEAGNTVFGYCCDMLTGADKGKWYTFSNLEDCDYYASEESQDHVRSIVMNGYWGTSDIPDENGEYELGSLELMKQNLRDAINNGEMENTTMEFPVLGEDGKPVLDEEGNPVMETKSMLELIDGLTEGEALLATQAAIWSYSNGSYNVQTGKDGSIIIDPDGRKWNHYANETGKFTNGECMDDYGSARVDFLYLWLINLDTDEESTIIINEQNFIEDMSLTVGDKIDEEEVTDENGNTVTNGIYETAMNFTLAFIPGPNDDLLMQLKYTDMDGKEVTVVRRLAGTNEEGESWDTIAPNEDGSYTISGLKLSENKDFNFDLRLEGTQYLEHGVYVYESVDGRDDSQTMVGIAQGEREVDISMGVTVSFSVDEENKVVAQRHWHDEYDPTDLEEEPEDPEDPPVVPDEEQPEPPVFVVNVEEDDAIVIEEEPVPLADAPKTGSNTFIWFALVLVAGLALTAVKIRSKKYAHETF